LEHRLVDDQALDDSAPLVEPAQRDAEVQPLRLQHRFLAVEDPHAAQVRAPVGERQLLPGGRHRQPVPRQEIGQEVRAHVPRRGQPPRNDDRGERRARAERPAERAEPHGPGF
jgi:hypothetical protein